MSKITSVKQQIYNKNMFSIFVDEEYFISVGEDTLVKYRLLKGTEIDKDEIEKILLSEKLSKGKKIAFDYLKRYRTKKEVERKLIEKGYDDIVEEVIEYLLENKYIDDEEYTRFFVRDKINLSKYGLNRIKQELNQKGVDKDIISRVISEEFDEENESNQLEELVEKLSTGKYRSDSLESKKRKMYGYLMRRGYSSSDIISALRKVN